MNLLLDTHVLLWWLDDPAQLSEPAAAAIRDVANAIYVSAATAWEIVIKKALGKLEAPDNLDEVLRNVISRHSPSRLRMRWPYGHFRCTIATHLTECSLRKQMPRE